MEDVGDGVDGGARCDEAVSVPGQPVYAMAWTRSATCGRQSTKSAMAPTKAAFTRRPQTLMKVDWEEVERRDTNISAGKRMLSVLGMSRNGRGRGFVS